MPKSKKKLEPVLAPAVIDYVVHTLLDVASERALLDIRTVKKFGIDDDGVSWMFADSKDLVDIAYLVQRGNVDDIKKAYKKAKGLGTAVRDDVPEVFWDLAKKVGVK